MRQICGGNLLSHRDDSGPLSENLNVHSLSRDGESHRESCDVPDCGECGNSHACGCALGDGCGGSSGGGSGHSCLCGGGHGGHAHGSYCVGECGGGDAQSSGVCGSRGDGGRGLRWKCVSQNGSDCDSGCEVCGTPRGGDSLRGSRLAPCSGGAHRSAAGLPQAPVPQHSGPGQVSWRHGGLICT